jgi:hypothetical protein
VALVSRNLYEMPQRQLLVNGVLDWCAWSLSS